MTRRLRRQAWAFLALGWAAQALVARLWLTDSWFVAAVFGSLGALAGLAAVLANEASSPARGLGRWLEALRRDELLPAVRPGLRFDLFEPATDRLLAEADTLAIAASHRLVDLEHLALAYLAVEGLHRPSLVEAARASLEERPELRADEVPSRPGLSDAATSALEAAYGEAVLAGMPRIAPLHVLRGVRVQLENPFIGTPATPLRQAFAQEVRSLLAGGSTPV